MPKIPDRIKYVSYGEAVRRMEEVSHYLAESTEKVKRKDKKFKQKDIEKIYVIKENYVSLYIKDELISSNYTTYWNIALGVLRDLNDIEYNEWDRFLIEEIELYAYHFLGKNLFNEPEFFWHN